MRQFVQGLNIEIQEALAVAQINIFTKVLQKAQRILEKAQRIEIARAQVKAFHARKKSVSSGYQG